MRLLFAVLAVAAMQSTTGCVLDPAEHPPALGTVESAAKSQCVRTCFSDLFYGPQSGDVLGCVLDLNGNSSFFPGMTEETCNLLCTQLRQQYGVCPDELP